MIQPGDIFTARAKIDFGKGFKPYGLRLKCLSADKDGYTLQALGSKRVYRVGPEWFETREITGIEREAR